MTRNDVIKKMFSIANDMRKNWTWDKYDELITIGSDWNAEHEDEEIFCCDYQGEDSEYSNGIMIEDEIFIFEA